MRIQRPLNQQLNATATFLVALQAGFDHARIIEYQHVARV